MKRTTASEARKNWYRLLDAIARGEAAPAEIPDYRSVLQASDADAADRWSWECAPSTGKSPGTTR